MLILTYYREVEARRIDDSPKSRFDARKLTMPRLRKEHYLLHSSSFQQPI